MFSQQRQDQGGDDLNLRIAACLSSGGALMTNASHVIFDVLYLTGLGQQMEGYVHILPVTYCFIAGCRVCHWCRSFTCRFWETLS